MPMPRIFRVMPSFWGSPRLVALTTMVGYDKAVCRSLRWFSAACDYYAAGRAVPEDTFQLIGCPELVDVGFAIKTDDGYRVSNEDEHFGWLKSQQTKGALGGRAKSANTEHSPAKPSLAQLSPAKPKGSPAKPKGSPSVAGLSLNEERRTKNEEERISIVARPRATPPIEDITGGTSGDMTPRPQDDTPCVGDAPEESPRQEGNKPAHTPESKPAPARYTDADRALAADWASWASTRSKTVRPDIARWADTFRLMREIDGLTDPDMRAMFDFVRSDDFWAKNAISPAHLRARSKNGLLKHENLRNSMTPPEAASRSIYDAIDLPEF